MCAKASKLAAMILTAVSSSALAGHAHSIGIPHLDLEMESGEYQELLQKRSKFIARDDHLDEILKYGQRLLGWVNFLNKTRPTPLALTTPETQQGFPIESPRVSNVKITENLWFNLEAKLPVLMKDIVIQGADFSQIDPMSDDEFLLYAREINTIYQRASRWILQEPNLGGYAALKKYDVRGYYHLSKISDLESVLKTNWPKDVDAEKIRSYLVMMCENNHVSYEVCKNRLKASEERHQEVYTFYKLQLEGSKAVWDDYFSISNPRRDASWSDQVMILPFQTPKDPEVQTWLKVNIEDEWQYGGWQLRLNFRPAQGSNSYMTRVIFQAGVTPNVNGLGGSVITMDANQPLQDYNTRWTIRHEYGHVLGFNDCYVEFYDKQSGEMVSYQLDITNLMCSRRGKLQQQHYDKLRKAYKRSEDSDFYNQ